MELFVLRTAEGWQQGGGAAVVIAETLARVQSLMREYELEDSLTVYESDADAEADVSGPFRHAWVQVETFPTTEERERIVLISWDEKI